MTGPGIAKVLQLWLSCNSEASERNECNQDYFNQKAYVNDNVQSREEQARQEGELVYMQLTKYNLAQRMYSLTYCQRRIHSQAKSSTKVETAQFKVNYNARYNNTVFCLRTEPHKGNNAAQRMRSLTRSQRSIHSEASLFPEQEHCLYKVMRNAVKVTKIMQTVAVQRKPGTIQKLPAI